MEHRTEHTPIDWLERSTSTVFTDLEKIFDECDKNCLGEVEISPLVDQICSMLPVAENQDELKHQLYQLLSSDEECTVVKKQEFEECMLKLIEKASANHLCSDNWLNSASSECFLRDKLINKSSTPIQEPRTCSEGSFDHSVEDEELFVYTPSKSDSISLQIKYNEEMLILSQRNAKLEMTVADLSNQISLQESSPCKSCRVIQSNIEKLKNVHSELSEANKHNDELLEELVGCEEERELLKHNISIHKKKCIERENEVIALQKQISELQEAVCNKQKEVNSFKELMINLQLKEIEGQKKLKYSELKLQTTLAENENLKKDIKKMLEHTALERKLFKVSLEVEEEENISAVLPQNNLMQELENEVSWYGFKDNFTQTTAILGNSLGVQVTPHIKHKSIQMSITLLNEEIQTDPQKLFDTYCQTEVSINPGSETLLSSEQEVKFYEDLSSNDVDSIMGDNFKEQSQSGEFQAAGETERNFLQMQTTIARQKKTKKTVGWMYLCGCILIMGLITATFYSHIASNCQTELLQWFNIKVVYLKPPPV